MSVPSKNSTAVKIHPVEKRNAPADIDAGETVKNTTKNATNANIRPIEQSEQSEQPERVEQREQPEQQLRRNVPEVPIESRRPARRL